MFASKGPTLLAVFKPKQRLTARRGLADLATIVAPAHEALQAVHSYTGIPWPVLIPLVTFGTRLLLTAPFAVNNRKLARRQAALSPLFSAMPPVFRAQLAQVAKNAKPGAPALTPAHIRLLAAREVRKQRKGILKQFGCQMYKLLPLPMVQIPLFVTMSLTIRAMCGWTVIDGISLEEGFAYQGFLWCTDLVRPDPFGVLPLLVGAAMLSNIELNTNQILVSRKDGPSLPAALANISRAGAVFFMAMAAQAPSAIGLYWLSSNVFSLCLNLALNRWLPVIKPADWQKVSPDVVGDTSSECEPPKKKISWILTINPLVFYNLHTRDPLCFIRLPNRRAACMERPCPPDPG